ADRVDSTTGVQMAYLKRWAPRAHNDLELRVPALLPRAAHGKADVHQLDALDAAGKLDADVVYLDPPYNQHSYLGNYHVWETLVRWDKPEVYGKACKRVDVRERQSVFNSKRKFADAFEQLLRAARCRVLVISFNNEGYLDRPAMEALLHRCFPDRRVTTVENDFKRYVGAQIGIHNPAGAKVGTVSHLRNKEYVFVVSGLAASG
ncbi:MAG: DNA adenine methylase, partial [Planctomycetota bacterium]